jgi:hypothetical protein
MVIQTRSIQAQVPAAVKGKACPQVVARERTFRIVLFCIAGLAALALAAHFAVLLWAQYGFTSVESIVALHANMLTHGDGIYYSLNGYPFTVSPYGPIFYCASALLHDLGLPSYQASRIISFAALLLVFVLCWRALGLLTGSVYAQAAGVLIAASTSNLLFWGTVGQVDTLGVCFSIGAFAAFLNFRGHGSSRSLALSGTLAVLAVFTKQTFLSAPVAIALSLLFEDRKRALQWIGGVVGVSAGVALALNAYTSGLYFQDAIWANINPFSAHKLQQHVRYLILTGAGVILTAAVSLRQMTPHLAPLHLYAALSTCVWLATAPKIGSDLNYQIEMMLVLSLCAACTLHQVDFFAKVFSGSRAWATLLQIPLLLHVAVNLFLTGRIIAERAILEPLKKQEAEALRPFVDRSGRLLSVHYDSLVHYRGRIEVEPFIYTLLVRAGRSDPAPLLGDLRARRFKTIIWAENLFVDPPAVQDPDAPHLLPDQVAAIRQNYHLVKHIEGVQDLYVYEPNAD